MVHCTLWNGDLLTFRHASVYSSFAAIHRIVILLLSFRSCSQRNFSLPCPISWSYYSLLGIFLQDILPIYYYYLFSLFILSLSRIKYGESSLGSLVFVRIANLFFVFSNYLTQTINSPLYIEFPFPLSGLSIHPSTFSLTPLLSTGDRRQLVQFPGAQVSHPTAVTLR